MAKGRIEYPYQNLSLVNLPKEKWKAIPDFEGYYELSNYGRVRSVPREIIMNSPHGGVYMRKERILRANLSSHYNSVIKQDVYRLTISLSRDGVAYYYPLGRLVYHVFKEKFDYNSKLIIVSPRDHDGRNVHVSNLVKTTMKAVKLASYREGRALSHLRKLSRPVTQFDQQGNVVRIFPSMYEAGRELGIGGRNIAEVVNGPGNMYKGFFWKAGRHTRNLNLRGLLLSGKELPTIHTSLQKRLGIRKIDMNYVPPCLNLSSRNMKGEAWKDIPGYEGLYQVSNFGRVKALQKITQGGKQMWMPERIKMLTCDFRMNNKGKEIQGALLVTLASNGRKRTVFVARFVYYLFVKKFKIEDSNLRIFYRDSNSLNTHHKNLILKPGAWAFNVLKKI